MINFPFTMVTFCVAFCTGGIAAYLARKRGRSPYVWFLIGFLFGFLGTASIFFFPVRKAPPTDAPPISKPVLQGPSDKFWYYLDSAHKQIGPMSRDALSSALQQGKVLPTTYVWNEELSEWKLLQELLAQSSPAVCNGIND